MVSPQPTPTENSTPPSLIGPLEIRFPDKPLRVEGQIPPIGGTPIEFKPIELRLPKEAVNVAVGGIPQLIKIDWEIKAVPLNVRWPDEPVKVSFTFDKALTSVLEEELGKRLGGLQNDLQENLKKQLRQSDRRIVAEVKGAVEQNTLSPQQQRERASARRIFLYILFSGFFGGFCGGVWRYLRRKSGAGERISGARADNRVRGPFKEELRQFVSSFLAAYPEWGRGMIFGIFAALMFPAASRFLPKQLDLRGAADDPYTLVQLCSACFIVAMVGELVVEWILDKVSQLLEERRFRSGN
jgi:hypothetical protein